MDDAHNSGKLTSTVTFEYDKIPLMPPCKKTIDMPQSINLPGGGIRLGGEQTPPPATPPPPTPPVAKGP